MTTNSHFAAAPAVESLSPELQTLQLVGGAFISQAIYVAAKLGVPDLLADGPKSAEYLSVATSTHESSLYRVLRALVSAGAFSEGDNRMFSNTGVTDLLRSDHPRSLKDLTIWMHEEEHWRVYGHMMHSVKTGEPAWNHVHGESVFPYLFSTNKQLGELFNRAMTSFSRQSVGPIVEAYDFSQFSVIADIAGGHGHLLAGVLASNPEAKGILFDLSSTLNGARFLLGTGGIDNRVNLVAGDFFNSVPVTADLYMLKHIMHDWHDIEAQTILRNVHRAMPDTARLVLIETVIPESIDPHFSKIMDLEMLLSPGGVERTQSEYAALLKASGFQLERVIPTASLVSVLETVKI